MQNVGDEINDLYGVILVIGMYSIHLVNLSIATNVWVWRHCKWPNHIKAPAGKRPGWRYGDKIVGWDVRLLAKELAVLASPHQVFNV
jgi:hypothetical protein